MIYSTDKEYRWKLFEHYATRLMMGAAEYAMTQSEYCDFIYLKHYFAPDYIKKKRRPWLPSVMDPPKQ